MANRDEVALILWDIDHTLVDIGSVSRAIYERAFAAVTGQPLRKLADMTGRTERAILIDTLALHGLSDPSDMFDDFYSALADAANGLRDQMRAKGRRLPGAAEAIAALAGEGIVQAVVTGNIKPIAVTKLDVFDLTEHIDFEVGGYGADGDTRQPLIQRAWERAERKYKVSFRPERIVVIGDTPLDVSAAHEVGIHAVGVAAGGSTVDDLKAAKAEAVVPDLVDVRALRAAVFGQALEE